MRTIIAGGRDITNYYAVIGAVMNSQFQISEVVSGRAAGVDVMGERWAKENDVPVKPFPAEWKKYGKAAGPIRNRQMAEYADALIAIWDGQSTGTKNMIDTANELGLKVYIFRVIKG